MKQALSWRRTVPALVTLDFTPEKRERSLHLPAETPKRFIGYDTRFSNDRYLENGRRTSEIIKCATELLVRSLDESICGKLQRLILPYLPSLPPILAQL
jgi:hypothetical protein